MLLKYVMYSPTCGKVPCESSAKILAHCMRTCDMCALSSNSSEEDAVVYVPDFANVIEKFSRLSLDSI